MLHLSAEHLDVNPKQQSQRVALTFFGNGQTPEQVETSKETPIPHKSHETNILPFFQTINSCVVRQTWQIISRNRSIPDVCMHRLA